LPPAGFRNSTVPTPEFRESLRYPEVMPKGPGFGEPATFESGIYPDGTPKMKNGREVPHTMMFPGKRMRNRMTEENIRVKAGKERPDEGKTHGRSGSGVIGIQRAAVFIMGAVTVLATAFPAIAAGNRGEYSGIGCPRANILGKVLSDLPWSEVLPVYLGGTAVGQGSSPVPENASRKKVCGCRDSLGAMNYGVVMGMWEPAFLAEFTRKPGCFPVLGAEIPVPENTLGSLGSGLDGGSDIGFLHAHLYSFPLFAMLNLFSDLNCGRSEYLDMDLLYASELDPAWQSELRALREFPESRLTASAAGVSSCGADAMAAYNGKVNNALPHCAGAWGYLYPLTGWTGTSGGTAENTSLLAARMLTLLHRRGLLRNTMGDQALCSGEHSLTMDKTLYRFSMIYPVPESGRSHFWGEPVTAWQGDMRIPPGVHEAVYVVWRYRNCCLGAGGG